MFVRSSFFSFFLLSDVVGFLLLFSTSIIIIKERKNPGQTERFNENDKNDFSFVEQKVIT
jgi:hypothetical protein